MNEQVKKIIQDSDKILIGLGDSFAYPLQADCSRQDLFDADCEKWKQFTACPNKRIEEAYQNLYDLVKDKDYFIVSICTDDVIYKSPFPEEKIVTPCGTFRYLQCSTLEKEECKEKLLPVTEELLKNKEGLRCPVCGKPLCFNHIYNEHYNEGGYLAQWAAYRNWLQFTINKKLCILELGVSLKFPNIIRWPFEKVGFYNQKASFIRVHDSLYQLTKELAEKGISVPENPIDFLLE